ncbi:SusE domain-containing protein [Thermophagus sp. OGC60D27]|uniref:SusE domain-containing protein n=1 Tax=Thermophagus sp. OGC60D27 TaxID=3458415 RepID=UPI0040384E5D
MKNIKLFSSLITALMISFYGCDDDPSLTVQQKVEFSDNITLSAESVILSDDNASDNALTISWPAVLFSIDAPVSYSVQFAINQEWASGVRQEIGSDVYSATFTVEELNTIVLELGLEADKESSVDVRVEAYLNQRVYSSSQSFSVTAYNFVEPYINYPSLYIAGDYQGWNIAACDSISSREDNGVYEGYIYIPPGGTNEFKVYAQKDWTPTSYGNGGDGKVIVANYAGDNFVAPSEGYYLFALDINAMEYLLIKIDTWGIIGDAAPNGWDSDIDMTFDATAHLWTVTADLKATGFLKIRANDAWVLDMGLDEEGNLRYANHPWLEYVDRTNLAVQEDGNYTITLDLRIPGNYRYSIQKN